MAKLLNLERNISLNIELAQNRKADIDLERPNTQNWIPFDFSLKVGEEFLTFSNQETPMFDVNNIRYLLSGLNNIVNKKNGKFEYVCSEFLFELNLDPSYEEQLVEFEIWFSVGVLANENSYGYHKGFKAYCEMDIFTKFTNELNAQYKIFDEKYNLSKLDESKYSFER